MNSKPLSQAEFLAKKQEALQSEPVARMVPLSDIGLSDNSYKDGVVTIGGKQIAADPDFFKKLGGILHISDGMRKDLTGGEKAGRSKYKKREGADDNGLFAKMVDTMKILKTSKDGGGLVTIIGNPSTGELTGVTDRAYNRIPNSDLFAVAETLINRYPVLSPVDIDVRGGGMGVDISLMSSADIGFGSSTGPDGGQVDEAFRFGFTMNNGTITSLGDFMYRLVCSNGLMGLSRQDQFQLKSLSNVDIRKMFEHIAEAEKRQFVPTMFKQQMQSALTTPASFREIESIYKDVTGNLRYEDDELKKHFKKEIAKAFFQGYVRTSVKLAKKEINLGDFTDKQKSFISTGQTMWDVINNVTWLGSHDAGYQWKNQKFLQKLGGKMMSKEFDLADIALLNL